MKNPSSVTSPKEHNSSPEVDPDLKEILAMNSSVDEIKNMTEGFNRRIDHREAKFFYLKDKTLEIIQSGKNKEKRLKMNEESLCEIWDSM